MGRKIKRNIGRDNTKRIRTAWKAIFHPIPRKRGQSRRAFYVGSQKFDPTDICAITAMAFEETGIVGRRRQIGLEVREIVVRHFSPSDNQPPQDLWKDLEKLYRRLKTQARTTRSRRQMNFASGLA